ncbi:MAG: efflux RND transporter periplasmic adaptor subunit [Paracoccus sp. (in: a-proteobacteria)]|uniref:efflux RND transporter periplasmic adaptor subunit n=1 Tax=Paracoccus sp. TaxID=267 RepID=UPI0039E3FD52
MALLLSLLPFAGRTLPWQSPPEVAAQPRPVVSIQVLDQITQGAAIPGEIKARFEVDLAFQTLGRMTRRNVDIGDVVTRGQILATLDPEDMQAEVRSAKAVAESAWIEMETARATARRTRALYQRNVATEAQMEQADHGLAAAQAAVQQAESQLIRARDAEAYTEMRAPFDGVISAVEADSGAVVSAGQPIMQLSSQQGLEAVIDLQPAMLSRISLGDPFEIWSENHPDIRGSAHVARIEPVADTATRTRRVRLELEGPQEFRLGALIRAAPALGQVQNVTVPAGAVFTANDQDHVWVVARSADDPVTGTVARRAIRVHGPSANGMLTVAEGLLPGEEVVIRGVHSLTEGQSVGRSVTP